jgi:hypothetical protein
MSPPADIKMLSCKCNPLWESQLGAAHQQLPMLQCLAMQDNDAVDLRPWLGNFCKRAQRIKESIAVVPLLALVSHMSSLAYCYEEGKSYGISSVRAELSASTYHCFARVDLPAEGGGKQRQQLLHSPWTSHQSASSYHGSM